MTGHTRRDMMRLVSAAGAGTLLAGPLSRAAFAAAKTQDYDDGNSNVPGGLVGDPERVIIVGAGWAGLTAANALRNAGVDHVVLDGRTRIGGRAPTAPPARGPGGPGRPRGPRPRGPPPAQVARPTGGQRTPGT